MAKSTHRYRPLLLLLLCCALVPASSRLQGSLTGTRPPSLDACGENAALFQNLAEKTLQGWVKTYHETVSKIIEEDRRAVTTQILCSADPRIAPGAELTTLARRLQPWRDPNIRLTQEDMPMVLLAYLRSYECTMATRQFLLPLRVLDEIASQNAVRAVFSIAALPLNVVFLTLTEEQKIITEELTLARPALTRTLAYLSGEHRQRLLTMSVQCLSRASLDIRNLLGLSAEASACLPRAQDVRGTLRTLTPL